MYACVHVGTHVHMHICACVRKQTSAHVTLHVSAVVCMYARVDVCIHAFMTHAHLHRYKCLHGAHACASVHSLVPRNMLT